MRKAMTLLLALFALASCDIHFLGEFDGRYDSSTFEKEMLVNSSGETVDFLIFTDAHIGRAEADSGVTEYNEALLDEIKQKAENGGYDFILSVGDLSDDGDINDELMLAFLDELSVSGVPVIGVIGNHELHAGSDAPVWESIYSGHGIKGPVGCYGFGEAVSVYALDSSWRILGSSQLDALESAMAKDSSKLKIVLSHTDLTSGEDANKSGIFVLGDADTAERNRLYRILSENGPSVLFTGHRHDGGKPLVHNSRFAEWNLAALHARDVPLQSEGVFYRAHLDVTSLTLTIEEVRAADRSIKRTVVLDF